MSTFTVSKGTCPQLQGQEECYNLCEQVKVCVTLQRGSCDYPNTVFHTDSPSEMVALHRDLVMYNIKFQNCSDADLRITNASLDLTNKFLLISSIDATESVVNFVDFNTNVTEAALEPVMRVLSFTSDKDCGKPNSLWGGGLVVYEPPFDQNASTKLFDGNFVVPPGECCVQLILAIDQIDTFTSTVQEVLIERASLCVKGLLVRNATWCPLQKSLILPGDCALRLNRATVNPECLEPLMSEKWILPSQPKVSLDNVAFVTTTGGGTGDSWSSPTTLELALAGLKTEVWVQQGTYVNSVIATEFLVTTSKNIYGGFLGNETDRDQRNPIPASNGTTMSGNGSIVIVFDVSNTYVLDGFTVQNGTGFSNGAGIFLSTNATLTLENVIVQSNIITATIAQGNGAGLYADISSTVNMANVTFRNNHVVATTQGDGGALMAVNSTTVQGYNVVFDGNYVDGTGETSRGGAITYFNDDAVGQFILVNCVFVNNYARNTVNGNDTLGGAIFSSHRQIIFTLTNCTFTENHVSAVSFASGGALFVQRNSLGTLFPVTLQNCIFWNNDSLDAVTIQGKEISIEYDQDSNVFVIADTLIENAATDVSFIAPLGIINVTKNGVIQAGGLADVVTANPLFVFSPSNVRLQSTSPAINQGYNANLSITGLTLPFLSPVAVDLDMHPRVIDHIVDMGAYEFAPNC